MGRMLSRAVVIGLIAVGASFAVLAGPAMASSKPATALAPLSAPAPAAPSPGLAAPSPGLAAPASCSSYPPAKPTVTLSSSTVPPGATITVSGSGFLPGSTVTVKLEPTGEVLATVRASGAGSFSVQVTIPASTPAGSYTIVVSGRGCSGSSVSTTSLLTVVPPSTTTTTSKPLPFTGASVVLPVTIGLVLLAIGLIAVVVGRRRPRTADRS
jgi:hypothetical protein